MSTKGYKKRMFWFRWDHKVLKQEELNSRKSEGYHYFYSRGVPLFVW
jgi:hypothetical protein